MAGTGKHILVRNIVNHEEVEYFVVGGMEMMYVEDEVVRMGGSINGEPQEGREHRWISVVAPITKESGERLKQLNEGARGRKEILGKMGEEGNRDMEELIYTRGPRCVREPPCRVRWASPIIQGVG